MKVLVLDCGSSSAEFQLVETDEESARCGSDRAVAKGHVENIRGAAACRVLVLPTNEELLIARDTLRIVRGLPVG